MLNNGKFLNDCNVCYDSESMAVLRQQLGYDGCVVTDWPMWSRFLLLPARRLKALT